MEKINLIIDTDISNEIDDQFALTYLLKSLENVNLQAITIAPFKQSGFVQFETIEEGTDLSFNVAKKIINLAHQNQFLDKIYKGATHYFYQKKESNPATEKIIEIVRENKRTTILSIGAITNIALAIEFAPDIVDKMDIIWLGGNSFLSEKNNEYNFRQDIEAVKKVFYSRTNLTVIPCKNVASNMSTTIYELEHYLKSSGPIGKYLCDIYKNTKKESQKVLNYTIGEAKVLWDMSAVAYIVNKEWFEIRKISCPKIMKNTSYKYTKFRHKIDFVVNLDRHKIFQDFFIKMGYKNDKEIF